MLGVIFIIFGTFSEEVSAVIGKKAAAHRQESLYSFIFLHFFFAWLFMLSGLLWMEIRFSADSLPILGARIIAEGLLIWLMSQAVLKSDRSTLGFVTTLTIPLITMVDLALGYALEPLNLLGIGLICVALYAVFRRSRKQKSSRRGIGYGVAGALLAVVTATLYKYDLTHYNSMVVEQSIVMTGVVLFYGLLSMRHSRKHSPLQLLQKPSTLTQSLSAGIAAALLSAAYLFMPASLVIASKRALALFWAVLAGHAYFHEKSLRRKLSAFLLVAVGLVLVAS